MAQTEEIKVSLDGFTFEEVTRHITGQQTTEEYFAFLERAVIGGTRKLPFTAFPEIKRRLSEEIVRVSKGRDGETAEGNS